MFSVFIPVGPATDELDRLADTLDSLRAHAPVQEVRLLLVDDCPRSRKLDRFWPGATVIRTPLWSGRRPDRHSAMTAGTLEALKLAEGEFALKLDTDAVVIAPFDEAIRSVLAEDPAIGLLGAYDRSADGGWRDWSVWSGPIRRAQWPIRAVRNGRMVPQVSIPSHRDRALARDLIRAANSNRCYSEGAHCLGGSYAVSPSLFTQRHLFDWHPWIRTHLCEDVTLGLLCGAAGLRMRGFVAEGEPFAVSWRGLPAAPPLLVERGHSIVHSVRDGRHGTESDLREWFRTNTR